mmetsp:Transcript_87779/g.223418  ORF Transcript_87779/g.223418 Transcript_87779/m.223418 type:complete len:122 (+) Transcript_87779:2-367(+)
MFAEVFARNGMLRSKPDRTPEDAEIHQSVPSANTREKRSKPKVRRSVSFGPVLSFHSIPDRVGQKDMYAFQKQQHNRLSRALCDSKETEVVESKLSTSRMEGSCRRQRPCSSAGGHSSFQA